MKYDTIETVTFDESSGNFIDGNAYMLTFAVLETPYYLWLREHTENKNGKGYIHDISFDLIPDCFSDNYFCDVRLKFVSNKEAVERLGGFKDSADFLDIISIIDFISKDRLGELYGKK